VTDTGYIKRLEEQIEELQEKLAKEQEFVVNINNHIWVINIVYGDANGEMYWASDVVKNSCLEKYVRKIIRSRSQSLKLLGYNFTRPYVISVDDDFRQVMNQKDNYWFDDKMLFIEGFEFDYALKKWMYKDSGNSMEFNMAFTEQVKKWFDEG